MTDLPAGFIRKARNLHPVRRASGPGLVVALVGETGTSLTVTGATGELDSEALSHEVRSILLLLVGRYHRTRGKRVGDIRKAEERMIVSNVFLAGLYGTRGKRQTYQEQRRGRP